MSHVVGHSVEEFYQKAKVLHEKAIALHRERYRVQGTFDKAGCQYMVDDIKALARDLERGLVDLDRDFAQ